MDHATEGKLSPAEMRGLTRGLSPHTLARDSHQHSPTSPQSRRGHVGSEEGAGPYPSSSVGFLDLSTKGHVP